jgi:t-SNARE complex subunit (syntaxin)
MAKRSKKRPRERPDKDKPNKKVEVYDDGFNDPVENSRIATESTETYPTENDRIATEDVATKNAETEADIEARPERPARVNSAMLIAIAVIIILIILAIIFFT